MTTLPLARVFYLRVDGVNLRHFVFDTRDLSAIRGGGLMLLKAVDTACAELQSLLGSVNVEIVSRGASVGLFRLMLTPETSPDALAVRTREALAQVYPDATFVVDALPADDSDDAFHTDVKKLLACNRWQQMQAASLAVPASVPSPPPYGPACDLDGVRPADSSWKGPKRDGRNTFLSPATHRRRKTGRQAKQTFYKENAGITLEKNFASEFEHIASDPEKGQLHGKLAVFYADGNGFSKVQATLCKTAEKQAQWDQAVRKWREGFLAEFLVEGLLNQSDWIFKNDEYRFETLLWGGDEFLFVMPAWKGWTFTDFFFEHTAQWNTRDAGLPECPLSHTAALVFCQHHSPIHRISALAKNLVDKAKDEAGRGHHQLVYQALESFDHLGTDLDRAMATRYRSKIEFRDLVLPPGPARLLGWGISELKEHGFPRSQLRALVTGLLNGTRQESLKDGIALLCQNAHPDCRDVLETLAALSNKPLVLWAHLEELWDYAAPT